MTRRWRRWRTAPIAGRHHRRRLTAALAKDRFDKEVDGDEVHTAAGRSPRFGAGGASVAVAPGHRPHVILFVGVNGSGKTTTIGKFAQKSATRVAKVFAAGDTFAPPRSSSCKSGATVSGYR